MLPKELEALLMKKKDKEGSDMSDQKVQAKLDVLHELIQAAQHEMGSRFKNGMSEMQKVSVMAPDKASLEHGLDKAKEIVDRVHSPKDDSSEPAHEDHAAMMGDAAEQRIEDMEDEMPDDETKDSIAKMDDEEESPEEEASESPKDEADEDAMMLDMSKKKNKEAPKRKKLFADEE